MPSTIRTSVNPIMGYGDPTLRTNLSMAFTPTSPYGAFFGFDSSIRSGAALGEDGVLVCEPGHPQVWGERFMRDVTEAGRKVGLNFVALQRSYNFRHHNCNWA